MSLVLSFLLLVIGIVAFVLSSKSTVETTKYLLLFLSLLLVLGGSYGAVKSVQASFFDLQLKKLEAQVQSAEDKAKKLQDKVQKYEDERKALLEEIATLNKEYEASLKKHEQNEKELRAKLDAIQSSYKPVMVAPEDARKFLLERIKQQEALESK